MILCVVVGVVILAGAVTMLTKKRKVQPAAEASEAAPAEETPEAETAEEVQEEETPVCEEIVVDEAELEK